MQTILIILDGWGYREESKDNAIAQAKKPFFDHLWKTYPHTLLKASGLAVGLPDGQMGNSEVGHTTIGAGSVIDTDLVRIGKAIKDGSFSQNKSLNALFDHVKKNNSTLHIQGLLGDGGVHAHDEHLYAVVESAKKAGISKIAIHVFTDGRDTPPQSAGEYLKKLEAFLEEVGVGFIATVSGRFYAMDRDSNWDRLAKVEKSLFEGQGIACDIKPSEFVESLYKQGKLDEHLEPIVCHDPKGTGYTISENDGIFFSNFRADRARMLTQKILERTKDKNVFMVTMTEYKHEFNCLFAFTPSVIKTTLAYQISYAGLKQAHIAETEKFAHATYFLNGGKEDPYEGEVHELVPSRKDVPTHDLAPKMRAEGIAEKAIEHIKKGTDFIFINFANPDMVGHTANVPAIVEAIEEVDTQLKRVVEVMNLVGGVVFITADHGNAEINIDPITGEKHTAHTSNLVPAILTNSKYKLRDGGGLADVAPTILNLMDLSSPTDMTGKSLLL